MIGFLKKTFGCVITLALIACGVHHLGYIVRPTDTDGALSQIETFHALPENTVEVMIYGSSHALRGLNTMELYDRYGIGAYNYSWHWQQLNTSKAFFQDSLLKQTPKVILLEAYLADRVLEDTNITAEIYYSRYLHSKAAKREYLQQCFGNDLERWVSFYMPLCAFHDNWNSLTKSSFSPLVADGRYEKTMGFSPSNTTVPVTVPEKSMFEQIALNDSALRTLDEIVEICRQKNIEIIFYTVPFGYEYKLNDAMAQYAQDNGCPFFDMFELMDEVGLDGATDFSDDGHLNTSGGTKVANYLGKYLVDHYDLTDVRMVEGNAWEQYSTR